LDPIVTLKLVVALAIFFGFLLAHLEHRHQAQVEAIEARHYTERKDLYDRLMARDLPEVKQAQAIRQGQPTVVSKRRNDMRLAEEAKKLAEQ